LVYSVTHDLRSPILSSKGLLSLILNQEILSANTQEYLGTIKTSLERLDKTILEILTYSKNSRLAISLSEINLNNLVETAFNSLKHEVNYPIELSSEINAECSFISDESRIKPILNNIISNSVRYSVNTQIGAKIKFKAQINKQRCLIEVSDNGEGIPFEHQDKVFNMFYRASLKVNGTGLGLFICSEVVKKLNGNISFISTPGVGTTFTIVLPNNQH
ncbi:MAG: sensor histidine kinase, partial [Proteobacteria bacterium]|nr:sensor histidine kinase [Pseudomonadota bacterium]